jgi:hypothetical protein
MQQTLPEAAERLEAVAAVTDDAVKVIQEVVADKGYHSRTIVHDLKTLEIRTYMSEPDRGPQSWIDQRAERDAVYANRRLSFAKSPSEAVTTAEAPATGQETPEEFSQGIRGRQAAV